MVGSAHRKHVGGRGASVKEVPIARDGALRDGAVSGSAGHRHDPAVVGVAAQGHVTRSGELQDFHIADVPEGRIHNTVLNESEGIGRSLERHPTAHDRISRGREGAHHKEVVGSGGSVDIGRVDVGLEVLDRAVARAAIDGGKSGISCLAAQGHVARSGKLENLHVADVGKRLVHDAVFTGDLKRVCCSLERHSATHDGIRRRGEGAHHKQVVGSVRQVDVGRIDVGLKVRHRAVARAAIDGGKSGISCLAAQGHVARSGKLENLHVADVGKRLVHDAVLGELQSVGGPLDRHSATHDRVGRRGEGAHHKQVVRSVRQIDVGRVDVGFKMGHRAVASATVDGGKSGISCLAAQGHVARTRQLKDLDVTDVLEGHVLNAVLVDLQRVGRPIERHSATRDRVHTHLIGAVQGDQVVTSIREIDHVPVVRSRVLRHRAASKTAKHRDNPAVVGIAAQRHIARSRQLKDANIGNVLEGLVVDALFSDLQSGLGGISEEGVGSQLRGII